MGYKNLRDGTRNIATVIIDPETAPHIEEAFKLYATGDFSLDHIRDFLFDRGMKNTKNSKSHWQWPPSQTFSIRYTPELSDTRELNIQDSTRS